MENYVKMQPQSVDELWEHKGDMIMVNAYASFWSKLFNQKMIGIMELPRYWENKDFYVAQKDLIWYLRDTKGNQHQFKTIKSGYNIDDVLDDNTSSDPLLKDWYKKQYKKELVHLKDINIIELYKNLLLD